LVMGQLPSSIPTAARQQYEKGDCYTPFLP
jgi:hypothetical protein